MYQISELERYSIIHAFSTVDDGNMSYHYGSKKKVDENREKMIKKLFGDSKQYAVPNLFHGDKVVVVDDEIKKSDSGYMAGLKADGLITTDPNVVLVLPVADCLPVILFDKRRDVLGLVHAGWKGTEMGIVKKAVWKMINEFSSDPNDIVAAIGPAIRKESYKFKDPLREKFGNKEIWKKYLNEVENGLTSIDLIQFTIDQMLDSGIARKNIIDSCVDTFSDDRFFSHYQDSNNGVPDQGRFAAFVGLKNSSSEGKR